MLYPIVAAAAFLLAVLYTKVRYRRIGFIEGLRAAGERHRDQSRTDFIRGKADGVRQAALWLRRNGQPAAAATLPNIQIEP